MPGCALAGRIIFTVAGQDAHQPKYAIAIETSGSIGSVALGRGLDVLESRTFDAPRNHARDFLPTLDSLFRAYDVAPSNLQRVFVSIGPGSFTGLRIGVTAARMLALAAAHRGADPPAIVAVPSLEIIAQNALNLAEPPLHVAVILDAKRNHIYAGLFRRAEGAYLTQEEPRECAPLAFLAKCPNDTMLMGGGVSVHRERIESTGMPVLPDRLFTARAGTAYRLGLRRAQMGDYTPPRHLVPCYIRPPEAEERWLERHKTAHQRHPID